MRVLAITPIAVDDDELARRQQRYDRLAPPGVTVHLENLGEAAEVPTALETAADIVASEQALVRRYEAVDPSTWDAFLPDCVLDPVVDSGARLPRPVHGIGRLTAHFVAGLGLPMGAVARNAAIATELDRKLASYGLASSPTAVMDLSVSDIADQATWAAAVEQATAGLGVPAVLNACSAVEVRQGETGPLLIDPTATALRMLADLEAVAG